MTVILDILFEVVSSHCILCLDITELNRRDKRIINKFSFNRGLL